MRRTLATAVLIALGTRGAAVEAAPEPAERLDVLFAPYAAGGNAGVVPFLIRPEKPALAACPGGPAAAKTTSATLIDATADCLDALIDGADINNGTVRVGVRCHGAENVCVPGDPVFHWLGLRYIPTGARSTEPGCQCEGWGIAEGSWDEVGDDMVCTGESGQENLSSGGLINADLIQFQYSKDRAISWVRVGDTFDLVHDYHPSLATPNLYEVTVTIRNVTDHDVNLIYRRVMDWDIDPTPFDECVSINAATAQNLVRTCTNGFNLGDPCSFTCDAPFFQRGPQGAEPPEPPIMDAGPRDHGALFDFDFGLLPSGTELSFFTYYGAAGNEDDAEVALTAVSAEAFSFGQPSVDCAGGTPNTFIFAFSGIGGRPVFCGNGVVDGEEECDDGNDVDGDGCDSNCTATACGNGIVTAGEDCDDGNSDDGDGCDADCHIEIANDPPELSCVPLTRLTDPGRCETSVECDDMFTCSDPDLDPVELVCSPAGPFTPGTVTIHGRCSDGELEVAAECELTVLDTEVPTCTEPTPLTLECNEKGGRSASDASVVTWLGTATASDNCAVDTFSHDAPTLFPAGCPPPGAPTRVTWTVVDDSTNSNSCAGILTIVDTLPPALSGVPVDATAECDAVPGPATPTAADVCDLDVTIDLVETSAPGICFDERTLTRTWTARDSCGNDASAAQKIAVVDTTAPRLSGVPADVTVECDSIPAAATPTAADNCDTVVDPVLSEATSPGSCEDGFTITRTWTATDDCDNSTAATQVLTVRDTTAPVFAALPADLTVECDAVPTPATLTASDNCDRAVDVTLAEATTPGTCADGYTITRTWTATDNCGNDTVHVQIVTVEDTTAPVFASLPADLTVECDAVPAPATVSASDNCDRAVEVDFDEVRSDGSCPDSYTLTRTWTATDDCGNDTVHVQRVTVSDTVAPVFASVPADATAECDAVPPPATLSATDNCDSAVAIAFTEVRSDGSCADNYTLTRTWTATDNCGNDTVHMQTVTVRDTVAPVFAGVPLDTAAECDAVPPPAVVSAKDNCDPTPVVAFAESRVDGRCEDSYTLIREWSATDRCGNVAIARQVVAVADTTAPDVVALMEPAAPMPPRSSSSPRLACSAPASSSFRVVCSTADNCDPDPDLSAVIVATVTDVPAKGTCEPRSEEIEVTCGEVVVLRLLAPACAKEPKSAGPAVEVRSDGVKVISGESLLLRVTARDRCGNDAVAEYDPAAAPEAPCDDVLDDGTCCPPIATPEPAKCKEPCPIAAPARAREP